MLLLKKNWRKRSLPRNKEQKSTQKRQKYLPKKTTTKTTTTTANITTARRTIEVIEGWKRIEIETEVLKLNYK